MAHSDRRQRGRRLKALMALIEAAALTLQRLAGMEIHSEISEATKLLRK
jgi:hypothetical protein